MKHSNQTVYIYMYNSTFDKSLEYDMKKNGRNTTIEYSQSAWTVILILLLKVFELIAHKTSGAICNKMAINGKISNNIE